MAEPDPKSVRFEVKAETTASPEQVIEAAGTDFSPRRAEIWPNVRKSGLTVHDDGHGFDTSAPHGDGMGLANLQRRSAKHGGNVDITSSRAQGTTVRIHLPLPTHG